MFNRGNRIRRSCEIDDAILTASEDEASRVEPPLSRKNIKGLWYLSVFILLVLASRSFYLNVIKSDYYARAAQGNTLRMIPISAPRGKLFDRNGESLVKNLPAIDIIASRPDFPADGEKIKSIVALLSKILNVSEKELSEKVVLLEDKNVSRVILKQGASQDDALRFIEKERMMPGVSLEQVAKRHYEDSVIFSHIIGYTGAMSKIDAKNHPDYLMTDIIGRDGLERSYEEQLRGIPGAKRIEVDTFGHVQREIASENPIPGKDIILNINSGLQKKLYDTMSSELEKNQLKRASAVALNPKNGEVLALVSFPSYDNNMFSERIDSKTFTELFENTDKPLFNRAISGEYPPGSTIKPVFACAALAEGIVTENTRIESRGGIQVGSYYFGDWKAHGFTDIREAIAVSSDVYFYAIGGGWGDVKGLGMERMKRYGQLFGLGEKTGIDLMGEANGFIPDEEWKEKKMGERWFVGNSYHASIGQGFILSTPVQLGVAMAAIANGGTVYEPRIVSQIKDNKGNVEIKKPVIKRDRIISDDTLRIVREGMRKTVTEGTAQELQDLPVEVAGKTGTAQYGPKDKTHGWFESFAPFQNPEIVLVVIVEEQDEHGYHAVPITKEVYNWYFNQRK